MLTASRYRSVLPSLFIHAPSQYEFRHSNYSGKGDRTKDSACAFAEGLWGSCGTHDSLTNSVSLSESPFAYP